MRILLANKFWYRRGGDCVYAMSLKNLLESYGHQVAVYAMSYPDNDISEWSQYWPSEMTFCKALTRPLGVPEVKKSFTRLMDDFKPDIVHLNNIHSQLSPVIAEIAHQKGAKVVWTLHDYKLLCPRYDCLRNGKTICNDCFLGKFPVIRHHCMKNSLPASLIAYAEAVKWNKARLEKCTDAFICPSEFLRQSMIKGNFSYDKLHTICNFIDVDKCRLEAYDNRSDYCCYIGRLSNEKGLSTLIKAASKSEKKLIIIGDGPSRSYLESIAGCNVVFMGKKNWDEIKPLLSSSRFMVIPSECNENNPLSVIESLCLGTPVLGSRIAGIPELIEDGFNGMTFEPGNSTDLNNAIKRMYSAAFDYATIAEKSQAKYNAESYYQQLTSLYYSI